MRYRGQIADFPREIVEKMLKNQVKQGNKRNITVFEKNRTRYVGGGGFAWEKTTEGYEFWNLVISYRKFHHFFEKYPKKEQFNIWF